MNDIKKRQRLRWIITVCYIAFIFGNSLLNGVDSGAVSGSLSEKLYQFLQIFGIPMGFDSFHHLVRKMAHFTEYLILGILIAGNTKDFTKSGKWRLLILFGVSVPLLDETIQRFVPGRAGALTDCMIDAAGYCVGVLFYHLFTGIRHPRQHRNIFG